MKNVTTKEAARRLHYTGDAQIRKLIQRGKLKAEKFAGVWVIAEEELQAFKRRRKQDKK
jgi:excisionase family DNA binding protein